MEKRNYGENYLKTFTDFDISYHETGDYVKVKKSDWEEACKILNSVESEKQQLYKILQDTNSEIIELKSEIRKLFWNKPKEDSDFCNDCIRLKNVSFAFNPNHTGVQQYHNSQKCSICKFDQTNKVQKFERIELKPLE